VLRLLVEDGQRRPPDVPARVAAYCRGVSPRFLRRPRQVETPPAPVERAEARQYRYLLSTAPFPVLDKLHREALATLDPVVRAQVLGTVQERLLTGQDLTVDSVGPLARLLTLAEVRTPGLVVSVLADLSLARLSGAVLRLPAAAKWLSGYDHWDGVDPDPRESVRRLPAARLTKLA
jgi:hypothetical protein